MENFVPGYCGSDPCATNNCSPTGVASPLCHPDLAVLPQVDKFRLIGVLGQCMVTMKCDFSGYVVSDGSGFAVSRQPCFPLPKAVNVKYDEDGNVITDGFGSPVEGDPPSMAGIVGIDVDGCQWGWRGNSTIRQKLVSMDGEVSWVDDPISTGDGSDLCTEVTCEVRIIPEGTIYTMQVNSTEGFVVGEAVHVDGRLYEVIEIVSPTSLAIRPYLPVEESYTIPAGVIACFAVYAPKCANTPEYDQESDGRITAVKVCTENGGDRLLFADPDKIIVGYEEDDLNFWKLQDASPSMTGSCFYPVDKEYLLFSGNKQRDTMLTSQVTFSTPEAQIPANTGRDLYMVVNIYSTITCSVLRQHFLRMWEAEPATDAEVNTLVHQHQHTNSSSNTSTNTESSMAIIKVPWASPRTLALWFKWTASSQSNPHAGASYVQIIGYYA